MKEPRLVMRLFTSSTIVSNFVSGIPNCNYEHYLRELLNASVYFSKRGGSPYSAPKSEDHGQCDAISQNYELDFKLLIARTEMQAASTLRLQPFVVTKGLTGFAECKNPGGSIKVTRIHSVLRDLSVEELEKIRKSGTSGDSIHDDIVSVLKTAEVNKNILFLFPYDFWYEHPICPDDAIEEIRSYLAGVFNTLLLYREKNVHGFDTYLTVKYLNEFLVLINAKNELHVIDSVPVAKMPTYQELSKFGNTWT